MAVAGAFVSEQLEIIRECRRDIEKLDGPYNQVRQYVVAATKEASETNRGEHDCNMKELSKYKHIYNHIDPQEAFIDAFSEGRPGKADAEENRLAALTREKEEWEQSVEETGTKCKQVSLALEAAVERLSGSFGEYEESRKATVQELEAVEQKLRSHNAKAPPSEAKQAQLNSAEEEAAKELREAQDAAAAREKEKAELEAELAALTAQLRGEEEAVLRLRQETDSMQRSAAMQPGGRGAGGTAGAPASAQEALFDDSLAWCQEMEQVLSCLAGVSQVEVRQDAVSARLKTALPGPEASSSAPPGLREAHHQLHLALHPGCSSVLDVQLDPHGDVPTADLVQHCQQQQVLPLFVLVEVRRRLQLRLHRHSVLQGLEAHFQTRQLRLHDSDPPPAAAAPAASAVALAAALPQSRCTVELQLPDNWLDPLVAVAGTKLLRLQAADPSQDLAGLEAGFAQLLADAPDLESLLHALDAAALSAVSTAH